MGKFGHDVGFDLTRCGSSECKDRHVLTGREIVPDLRDTQVTGPEVISPFADAVCLIDSDEANGQFG